MYPNN